MGRETVATELDVRAIDGEPFSDIVGALDQLESDETLRLVSDFQPVPLYGVLETRGFTHDTERVDSDTWHMYIGHD